MQDETLGLRIKRRLQDIGETQQWLARKLNVREESISRWINGGVKPGVGNLHRMSKELGVTVAWLLTGANPTHEAVIPTEDVQLIARKAADEAVKQVLDRLQDWLLKERVAQMTNASRRGEA